MIAPVLVTQLFDIDMFSSLPGEIDSWIMFWGSYAGAIIGACTVYLVARLQIKKQNEQQITLFKLENEQQIKSIELENIHSTKREMKKFYLTNKLEKLEEMLLILERLSSLNIELNNDLVTFSVVKSGLEIEQINKSKEELNDKIYELRTDLHKHHFKLMKDTMRLTVLSEYASANSSNQILGIQKGFANLFDKVRKCYYSKDDYKQYLAVSNKEGYTIKESKIVHDLIIELGFIGLQQELRNTLEEIGAYLY